MTAIVRRLSPAVVAGLLLFVVNNVFLARVVTRLPGGTAVAVTDMVAVALTVLSTRRFGSISIIYLTYGLLGFLGHLGVDAQVRLMRLPLLLVAAMMFDVCVALGRYRWRGLAMGVVPFVVSVFFLLKTARSFPVILGALGLAYIGLAAGAALHLVFSAAWRARSPGLRTSASRPAPVSTGGRSQTGRQ